MKNFYKNELIMSKQLDRRLSLGPLSINLTEDQLLDSEANRADPNQVDLATYQDSLQTLSNDITGMYASNEKAKEIADDSGKQKAYVDFDLFYTSLKNARLSGLIDSASYKNLKIKAKD